MQSIPKNMLNNILCAKYKTKS